VRWTRIEQVVIIDWLSGKPRPEGAIIVNASSLPNPARDASASIPSTDSRSPTGGRSMASPAFVDVGSIP
jgi:hypothetical protein